MNKLFRVTMALISFLIAYLIIALILTVIVKNEKTNYTIITLAILLALGVAWLVFKKTSIHLTSEASYILTGGFLLGGLGFAIGFLGPIIIAPNANQGPLLGIFITGPLGFLLGLLIGGILWRRRKKQINN